MNLPQSYYNLPHGVTPNDLEPSEPKAVYDDYDEDAKFVDDDVDKVDNNNNNTKK